MLEFRVDGTPVTWRTTEWGRGHSYKYPPLTAWQDTVAITARQYVDGMTDSPWSMSLVFVLERPKSHWTKAGNLTKSAPRWCTSKKAGDLTNHRKAVEDALTGVVYCDDSQVVEGFTAKRYAARGESPGVMIQIKELEDAGG